MGVYRNYKRAVLWGVGLICAAYVLNIVGLYTLYCGPKGDAAWVNALYGVKEAYAKSIEEPKVLLVSGSSLHFGLSAETMEAALEVPVVNLGTHAGLLEYVYARARRSLKPGDLVIVAPEYAMYTIDNLSSAVRSDYLVSFDKTYLRGLPVREQFEILQGYMNPIRRLEKHLDYIRKQKKDLKKRRYIDTLNSHGDESKNIAYTGESYPAVSLGTDLDTKSPLMVELTHLIEWCQSNDVQVLMSWPGTLKFQESHLNAARIEQLKDYWRSHAVEILGEPEDFFCSPELLFDTEYHLNLQGVAWRTKLLLDLLEQNEVYQHWALSNAASLTSLQ